MAKKKKANSKLDLLSIILLAVAGAGLVLAIVGVAIPWFTADGGILGSKSYGLFADGLEDAGKLAKALPIASVQALALIALILGAVACVGVALHAFGILKLQFLVRVIFAALVVACAIVALILGLVYADKVGFDSNAGLYLLTIGSVLASVPLALKK